MTNSLIEFIRSQLLEINQATHHWLNALLPPHPPQPPSNNKSNNNYKEDNMNFYTYSFEKYKQLKLILNVCASTIVWLQSLKLDNPPKD
jgi:hypothetical protein